MDSRPCSVQKNETRGPVVLAVFALRLVERLGITCMTASVISVPD